MAELTIDRLSEAVAGGAVALRSIMRLQPADGPGGQWLQFRGRRAS